MATDGPTPSPCNPEIFKHGSGVCTVYGSSNAIERWVKAVAKRANAQVDWHYCGGLANVLHLGDGESLQRVLNAINELEDDLDGTIRSVSGLPHYREDAEDIADQEPLAVLREIDGKLVMCDPVGMALAQAIGKHSCLHSLKLNANRIGHFKGRMAERGLTEDQVVIVFLNVNDVHGGPLAEALMPGHDWQKIRDQGKVPFARGLVERAGMHEMLGTFDTEAATKLLSMTGVAVVVVDHGVAEVYGA